MEVLIENINEEVIHVNEKLDEGYKELNIEKIVGERKSNGTKYVRDRNVFNLLNFNYYIDMVYKYHPKGFFYNYKSSYY